jgi:hypothetical protein
VAERVAWAVSHNPGVMTTVDVRHSLGSLWWPGSGSMVKRVGRVPNATAPLTVTATSPTPDGLVHVSPGYMVSMGTRSIAPYIQVLDAIKDINILSTPAHASLTRWDLIIAQQNDELHSDADNTWTVKQVVGTPSATPADPTVTGSPDYVVIARVVVGGAVTSITNANITQLLTNFTVPVGGLLPVADQTARDALTGTRYDGMAVWRQDRDWIEIYDGTAWRVQGVAICTGSADLTSAVTNPVEGQLAYRTDIDAYFRYTGSAWRALQGIGGRWRQDTTGQSIPATTDTKVTFNTAIDTPVGISYSAGEFTVAEPGKWDITASLVYPFTASLEMWAWLGPSTATTTRWDVDTDTAPSGVGPIQPLKAKITRTFTAAEKFSLWTWHSSGVAKTLDVSYGGITHLEATYLGPA